jgi:hypothetical protein
VSETLEVKPLFDIPEDLELENINLEVIERLEDVLD